MTEYLYVCNICGLSATGFISQYSQPTWICLSCSKNDTKKINNVVRVIIPIEFGLLIRELQSMQIQIRVKTV
jgi:DNA-directed RNA polymerase beta subunit